VNPRTTTPTNPYLGAQVLKGSYVVDTGPLASTNPTPESCLDRAVSMYGGFTGMYLCSNSSTGNASQTAWADFSGVTAQPAQVAEDFSYDSCPVGYGLGTVNDTSAFVNDHGGGFLNYVFLRVVPCSPPCPSSFTQVSGCTDTSDRVCM